MKHERCKHCGTCHPHYSKEWLERWLAINGVFRHLALAAAVTAPLWFLWEIWTDRPPGFGGWAWVALNVICRHVVGRIYEHIERRQRDALQWVVEHELAELAKRGIRMPD